MLAVWRSTVCGSGPIESLFIVYFVGSGWRNPRNCPESSHLHAYWMSTRPRVAELVLKHHTVDPGWSVIFRTNAWIYGRHFVRWIRYLRRCIRHLRSTDSYSVVCLDFGYKPPVDYCYRTWLYHFRPHSRCIQSHWFGLLDSTPLPSE